MSDPSLIGAPAGPRTARKTDLLVCAAEFVCSSWCGGVLWVSSKDYSIAPNNCAALGQRLWQTSFGDHQFAGRQANSQDRWFQVGRSNYRQVYLHLMPRTSPPAEREVRNQRGFGGLLVTLGPWPKSPAPESGILPSETDNNSRADAGLWRQRTCRSAEHPLAKCDRSYYTIVHKTKTTGGNPP